MMFVGIDWSSLHDDVCILDAAGQMIKQFRVPVSAAGFAELMNVLDSVALKRDEIFVAIESPNDIAARFLIAAGYTVYAMNPLSVNRFKERYKVSAKKDDRFDAMNLALILFSEHQRFTPVRECSPEARTLLLHCETLDDLIRERTRLINRFRACLMRYFPAFLGFFSNLRPCLPHHVLTAFPRPGELCRLTDAEFAQRAAGIVQFSPKRQTAFLKFIKEHAVVFENPDETGLALRSVSISRRMLELNSEIKKVESEIDRIFEAHSLAYVFKSVPGAGARLAPNLLACFGDQMEKFASYQQLQCYAGTAPVTKQSGKSEFHTMRRACNKHFRYILYTLSFTSLKSETWVKRHYTDQRNRGKTHASSMRSVSNKWAKILFSMWKNGTQYQSQIFEAKKCRAA